MDLVGSPLDIGDAFGGGLLIRALSNTEPVASPTAGATRSLRRLSPAVLPDRMDYSALGAAAARSLMVRMTCFQIRPCNRLDMPRHSAACGRCTCSLRFPIKRFGRLQRVYTWPQRLRDTPQTSIPTRFLSPVQSHLFGWTQAGISGSQPSLRRASSQVTGFGALSYPCGKPFH